MFQPRKDLTSYLSIDSVGLSRLKTCFFSSVLTAHGSPPRCSTSAICAALISEPLTSHRILRMTLPGTMALCDCEEITPCWEASITPACRGSFQPFWFWILLHPGSRVHLQQFEALCSHSTKQKRWFWKIARWFIIHQRSLTHPCTWEQEAMPLLTGPAIYFLLAPSIHSSIHSPTHPPTLPPCVSVHSFTDLSISVKYLQSFLLNFTFWHGMWLGNWSWTA